MCECKHMHSAHTHSHTHTLEGSNWADVLQCEDEHEEPTLLLLTDKELFSASCQWLLLRLFLLRGPWLAWSVVQIPNEHFCRVISSSSLNYTWKNVSFLFWCVSTKAHKEINKSESRFQVFSSHFLSFKTSTKKSFEIHGPSPKEALQGAICSDSPADPCTPASSTRF